MRKAHDSVQDSAHVSTHNSVQDSAHVRTHDIVQDSAHISTHDSAHDTSLQNTVININTLMQYKIRTNKFRY